MIYVWEKHRECVYVYVQTVHTGEPHKLYQGMYSMLDKARYLQLKFNPKLHNIDLHLHLYMHGIYQWGEFVVLITRINILYNPILFDSKW